MVTIYLIKEGNKNIRAIALSRKEAEQYKELFSKRGISTRIQEVTIGYDNAYINE